MGYNILGVNLSHNSSVCVLSDGEIIFFLEEDRLSRNKNDDFPLNLIYYISKHFKIDEICVSGLGGYYLEPSRSKTLDLSFSNLFPNSKLNTKYLQQHHLTHSSISFYNSGFNKSLSVVVDGNGEEEIPLLPKIRAVETETISTYYYPLNTKEIYKSFYTDGFQKTTKNKVYSPLIPIAKLYENISRHLKFNWMESGKTMGLASYGKLNNNIPKLFINTKSNPRIISDAPFIPNIEGLNFNLPSTSKEWHRDSSKITNFEKDLAYKVQQESQQAVGDLIEKGLKETGLKQVCCTGGYFLNCVANYYLAKRFPDVEFYFEPISSDAGNAIGVAKLIWYEKTQDTTIRPQKTLYYGPKYSKKDLLKGIQKYVA